MSQTLIINGKEYVQSSALTTLYKYTPDYIGKLAREEKIIGTQVGRQWYIEPESLKVFLHKVAIEKEIKAEELSLKRKIEHHTFQKDQLRKEHDSSPSALKASLQATLVVACGLLVGTLGFSASHEGIGVYQIVEATRESARYITHSILPSQTMELFDIKAKSFLAASQEGITPEQVDSGSRVEVFGTLPQTLDEESPSNLASKNNSIDPSITTQFSDEVQIVTDQNGKEFLKPLFKNQESPSSLFMVVPVVAP
jgi:hypothetical protein